VREVRALVTAEGLDGKVAGHAALSVDIIEEVVGQTPKAVAYILITTTILIFLQVRSVLIPLKAIAMNILSLTASFGMLVFIFQEGHGFENILNFTPQPVDPTTPVILFCIVFGMSMDYEVLMLSRIHETWLETGDNTLAVSLGLQRTGRLITGAAAVMVVVFGSFVLAEVQIIKAIGLGLALAIFIDATLVRALVVPAAMRLMGRANWWSPRWLGGGPSQPREE
jgi:RND superfamily putative drug exporter